ncbi:MAG: DUF3109 family protein [Bacteroidales bacterium]|nr:DUF3109 family protein [Bacteroidales bacterium]MBQ6081641.1 DUF3109 family protein [Bacteroidales bacterium]MBQ7457650.1 DUF3109 family protein [Bacteroidales bacterium]MBQ9530248.1 DUF3109 family protein [Bacteroidales bacterium]
MISINDILISDEILTEYFACDYEHCKGACCVIGESGAPLAPGEDGQLEQAWPAFSPLMTADGRAAVAAKGFFEIDGDGDMVTPLMEISVEARQATGNKTVCETTDCPCAYTFFEDGNCLCAVERTHICGKCDFVKPISCRLYPIREVTFSDGSKALNLHRWTLCREAFEKGRREGVKVYQFLREPIIAAYGADFYAQLAAADSILQELSGRDS